MYKTLKHLLFAVIFVSVISCGSKKANEDIVAPQGMHTLNLNRYGKSFAIFVPDTVANKLHIIEQSNGSLDIKVGKNFAISINEQPVDIELRKKDMKEDEVNKFKGFIMDEPTAVMWESEIVQPEFHFIVNHKIGETEYSFEDIKDTEANPFGKEAIQKMFDSAKNIKEIKRETNS
jgi:hypothetical protein